MDQWAVLGIDPTRDQQKIRRAYAQRSRECHPEEHPRSFRSCMPPTSGRWTGPSECRHPPGKAPRGCTTSSRCQCIKRGYTPAHQRPLPLCLPLAGRRGRLFFPLLRKGRDLEFEAVFARADELRQQEA